MQTPRPCFCLPPLFPLRLFSPHLLLQKLIKTESQVHSNSIWHCVENNSNQQWSDNISTRCNQIITSWIKMLSRQTITWKPIKPLQSHPAFSLSPFNQLSPLVVFPCAHLLLHPSFSPLSQQPVHTSPFPSQLSFLPPPSVSSVSIASAEGHSSRIWTKGSLFSVAELWSTFI